MNPANLEPRQKLELYYWMRLTRTFDERMVALWKQGRGVGGTFSQRGHEAISVGVGYALGPDDVVAPMHRDLGTFLLRGITPRRMFANLLGRETGPTGGRDVNLHGVGDLGLGIFSFISHLPQSLPVGLGAAMSFRYRDEPRVAVAFTGDGASNAGLFHETLNMASLYNAPLVVMVENNQYAYSTPTHDTMKVTDIAQRAAGYGIPGLAVDGNDVEAVYAAAAEAIERARAGGGPTLIEAKTMRMLGHAIHDGAEYVPPGAAGRMGGARPGDRLRGAVDAGGRHGSGGAGRDRRALPGGGDGCGAVRGGQPAAPARNGDGGRLCRVRSAC